MTGTDIDEKFISHCKVEQTAVLDDDISYVNFRIYRWNRAIVRVVYKAASGAIVNK